MSTNVTQQLIHANEYSLNSSMSRQAIINGNFDVWQRGTTDTGPADSTFLADRWKRFLTVDGGTFPTLVHSRQLLTSGDLYGSYYFYRIAPNGAGTSLGASSYYLFAQLVENGSRNLCGNGKKVTLSFYARASVAGKKIGFYSTQQYGTGGSPSAEEVLAGTNFTLTSSWVKYTYTYTTNTLSGKTFGTDNNDYLSLIFAYQWGTGVIAGRVGSTGVAQDFGGNGTIDIAQVQLCAGDVALPFQPKSFDDELRACMRYCIQYNSDLPYSEIGVGSSYNTTSGWIVLHLPTKMRIIPTLSVSAAADFQASTGAAAIACNAISLVNNQSSKYLASVGWGVASGATANIPYRLEFINKTTSWLRLDAEL